MTGKTRAREDLTKGAPDRVIYPLTMQAQRLANKPAVIEDRPDGSTVVWTYSELNRQANRLAPEETAYIVEDSDAVLVWVDAEHADTFAHIRSRIPRVREIVVFGGTPLPGMLDGYYI